MSSILKALKKLEQDKSVRKPYSFRIDTEILQGAPLPSRRPFSIGITLAAIALFLCGVGATYLFMRRNIPPATVQPSQATRNEDKIKSSSGSTMLPVPNVHVTETKPLLSVQQPIPVTDTIPKPNSRYPGHQHVQAPQPAEPDPQAVKPEPKPVPLPVPVAPVVSSARSDLKVNGIAFQDGTEGVAVINGITVSNGSVIEGARVEEIQKDRVRFSRGGEKFDILLDKSN
jgi:general secretion pathway protein B